ncbi:hypothetical protein ACOSQ3_019765 [Xanthoceras sorbifolium]
MCEDYHDINRQPTNGAAYCKPQIAKRSYLGEYMRGLKPATSENQEHHAIISQNSDREEYDGAHDPPDFLEGVWDA